MKSLYLECEYLQNQLIMCLHQSFYKSDCNPYRKKIKSLDCSRYNFIKI